jgi:hypothetical protein
MNTSGETVGRDERGWLFPRGPVTPQPTRSPRISVRWTPEWIARQILA